MRDRVAQGQLSLLDAWPAEVRPRDPRPPRAARAAASETAVAVESAPDLLAAWVDGELDPAISGISVPVRDHANGIVAAISVNFISGSLDETAAKARFLGPLRRAAEDIRARTPAL